MPDRNSEEGIAGASSTSPGWCWDCKIQAAICVMLPEQNAGKVSQKILNSLRVQFGRAGDGVF